jgi:rhodanese-related sulfurtransferase
MSNRIPSVSPSRFHALRASGLPATLVDVRSPAEYRSGHPEGALLIPLEELTPASLAARSGRPDLGRGEPLFLTCQGGARAALAADRLAAAGYRDLAVIEGGAEAWQRSGLPMRRCGSAMPLDRQVQIAVGTLVLLKVVLGLALHEVFFAAAALIGVGLIVAGLTRWCGLARLLALMPWNRGGCPEEVPA